MIFTGRAGQNTAMHGRVQGLDPSREDLGRAGIIGHFGHRQVVLGQQTGRTAGSDQGPAQLDQAGREFDNPVLSNTERIALGI